MYIRAGIEMRAPAVDYSTLIAHCDPDWSAAIAHEWDAYCDYDPFDDGPRDNMGWTKKERARRTRSEERAKVWTRWYNRKKRLQTRSQVRQAEDRSVLRAASSTRPHTDSVCRDVNDKSATMLKKPIEEEKADCLPQDLVSS